MCMTVSLLLTQYYYLFSVSYMHKTLEILIFLSKVTNTLQITQVTKDFYAYFHHDQPPINLRSNMIILPRTQLKH